MIVSTLVALVLAAEPAPPTDPLVPLEPPKAHDPFQGMDRNGRIPAKSLPFATNHPERWRYVPEGRLKPGNLIDRLFVSSFVAPIVFYEEAVGGGGGVAITDLDFRNQRRQEFLGAFASRSTQGQEGYSVLWQRWLEHRNLPGGGIAQEENTLVRVVGSYERTLTRRFYGIGPDSSAGDETSYTDELGSAETFLRRSLPAAGDDWTAQLGLKYEQHNVYRGRVRNRPSTDDVHPALVAAGDGVGLWWVNAGLTYDRRDSRHNPYRGWMLSARLRTVPAWSGGEAAAIGSLEATWQLPVPGLFHDSGAADLARLGAEENPPTDVLAIGGQLHQTWGRLPYWALPGLGGSDTLRGFIGDRFTGRAAWHLGAEWRICAIPRGFAITDSIRVERIGVAPFVEVGTVAERAARLPRSRQHWDVGLGFRASLERTAQFRFDIARSPEQWGFNAAFGLPF